ncbi:tripartite tricarboxylate transporter TctB family protein [uncultured Jannaschia sp.]|uniref:tripartite tricarboxylate transporter TctB family protein n=1 Tax=uncultured Jannaschia sp. TaxID=293347 RepID=UPI00260C05EA|nr:tripartite tricarboxylate transporter TctB family protein [uncultured Jannaschia sp.]
MPLRSYAYDWIAWVVLLAIPLIVLWQNTTSLEEQGVAGGGPMTDAAMYPGLIAWILVVLSGVNGVRILAGRVAGPSPIRTGPTTMLAIGTVLLFVVYLLALRPLGYHLTTPVLLAVLLRAFGLSFWTALLGGVAVSLTVAAVFEGLLNVVLPVGMFSLTVFG